MTKPFCDDHTNNCHRLARLEMRMDRIEIALVVGLLLLIGQLWMLWDLPARLEHKGGVVESAHAEGF